MFQIFHNTKYYLLIFTTCLFSCNNVSKSSEPPTWLKTLSIYEVMPKNFSEKQNLNAIKDEISQIRTLYVNAIALTPICSNDAINSSFNPNDPYASINFSELDKSIGKEEDLKNLIETVHQNKMKILLEFDISYTGPNHPWRTKKPDYYKSSEQKINDLYNPQYIQLNFDNPKVRKAALKALNYWKSKFSIDGIILLNTEALPKDFCETLSNELKTKEFLLGSGSYCPDMLKSNTFDVCFNTKLYDELKKISTNEAKASAFKDLIETSSSLPFKGTIINYSRNAKVNLTDLPENQIFPYYYKLPAIISIMMSGIPWILNGQEEPMFEKLDVKKPSFLTRNYQYCLEMYRGILIHRRENGALFSLENNNPEIITDSEEVLAFERKIGSASIVLMANLTDHFVTYKITKSYNQYIEFFTRTVVSFVSDTEYKLGPHQYLVLTNKH